VPAKADKVTITGVHLCCKACVKGAEAALSGVKGVSDVKIDQETKTITCKTKLGDGLDAVMALFAVGLYGQYDIDNEGKGTFNHISFTTIPQPHQRGKADEITVEGVHICCKACQKTIEGLYPEAKITFLSKTEFKLAGKDMDRKKVIEKLQKAGLNGSVAKQ
jgi:copper chaperone CopZ